MNKALLSIVGLSTLAIAAPAAAQPSGRGYQDDNSRGQDYRSPDGYRNRDESYGNVNFSFRLRRLQDRIEAGVRAGDINPRQAMRLREQLRQLTRLERQYSINGLTSSERYALQQRLNELRRQIQVVDRGGNGRWDADDRYGDYYDRDRDGWDDRDLDRDGRWDTDSRYDNDRDGWDDRDRDRDGRWEDDVNDGGYRSNGSGVVGQVLDSIAGGGTLRVGQRAPDDLYGVPSEYRNQYRDGSEVYYRSDNRSIYEIDARTRTVVRVYPMRR